MQFEGSALTAACLLIVWHRSDASHIGKALRELHLYSSSKETHCSQIRIHPVNLVLLHVSVSAVSPAHEHQLRATWKLLSFLQTLLGIVLGTCVLTNGLGPPTSSVEEQPSE